MKNNINKLKIAGVLVLLVSLFIFISVFEGGNKFQSTFFSVVSIPQKALFTVGDFLSGGFKVVFTLDDVLSENAQLRSDNRDLKKKLIDKEKIKEENIQLREQLNIGSIKAQKLLEAKITSFEPSNLSEFLVINKGSSSFIKKDMPIILPGNILLGKVFEVYKDYSKVMLILDRNNKVNVKSFFDENIDRVSYSGVLSGHFGKALFMDLIEKQSLILKDDLIVTSGFDGIYPEDLIVGRVDIIKDDDNSVFKQVYLKPEFLPIKSTLVFVILK
jgi:rod shape-determining protein MreC